MERIKLKNKYPFSLGNTQSPSKLQHIVPSSGLAYTNVPVFVRLVR